MWSAAKIAAPFILFAVSFVSGVTPSYILKRLAARFGASSKFSRIVSVLNCFSGGIFFATSILDLLSESRHNMDYVFEKRNIHSKFPLSECIMGAGFLSILFIEHVAHLCHARFASVESTSPKQTKVFGTNDGLDSQTNRQNCSLDSANFAPDDQLTSDDVTFIDTDTIEEIGDTNEQSLDNTSDTSEIIQLDIDNHGTESKHKPLRNLVLLVALSIHMIFDGLAVGILENQSQIWQLLLALSIHKSLVFVTIGIQLHQILKSLIKTIVAVLLFALVSPAGVVIAELISSNVSDIGHKIVSAVMLSFVAGNFLFITFFEILQRELVNSDHDLVKVISIVIGYSIFAVAKFLIK